MKTSHKLPKLLGSRQPTKILAPLRVIARNTIVQPGTLIPPMCHIAAHFRSPPRVHIHHVILDHRLPLAALDDSLRPASQLHRHIVLRSARQQPNRVRAINPAISAIHHARCLRIQSLDNCRRIHQSQSNILGSNNLQPAPEHLFRLQPIGKKLMSRQSRLLHQSSPDRFLQHRAQLIHCKPIHRNRTAPNIPTLIIISHNPLPLSPPYLDNLSTIIFCNRGKSTSVIACTWLGTRLGLSASV
jgi:hypothetical protein